VHPTDFIMMTCIDFFPASVYNARTEDPETLHAWNYEPKYSSLQLAFWAFRSAVYRSQRNAKPKFTPEQIAERAARRAAYKLEHIEYVKAMTA